MMKKQIIILVLGAIFLTTSPLFAMDAHEDHPPSKILVAMHDDGLFRDANKSYTVSCQTLLRIFETPGKFPGIDYDHEFLVRRNSGEITSYTLINNIRNVDVRELLENKKVVTFAYTARTTKNGISPTYRAFFEDTGTLDVLYTSDTNM